MEKEQYQLMYELELHHWWYRGMQAITRSLLEGTLPKKAELAILDAGCGSGGMLLFLSRYGCTTGVDISPDALALSRSRELKKLIRGSIADLPLADGAFDLVTSFDVIYHRAVGEDVVALKELCRVLKAGGRLLVRVPAYEFMRGHHDEAVHTRHRYRAPELKEKLAATGFEVERMTYANTLLFPLAAAKRALERKKGLAPEDASDLRPLHPVADAIMGAVLGLEARLVPRIALPFGLSLFCVAKKV